LSKNKDIMSVSFNKTKENDMKMLEHLEGKNFSGYVKELIWEEIKKKESSLRIVQKSEKGGIKIVVGR
jgi:hypothetical protein